jgi:alkanesulfonate monooxygenase SsuD/methylene tetrahydromethanopterin reductase-like flavin-dependent oxidoreductase (luciferase family)
MKLGISFVPDATPTTRAAADYYADALRLAVVADEAGLDWVKMTEHYLHPYGGYCPSPLTFLAAVAARTERIRLMTGCVLPVFHHPVELASHAAMVDAMSGGRLDLGVARAYLPYEFDTFGVSLDESRARYDAVVEAMIRLWTEEKVTEHTPYFSYQDATILPRPVQSPHPPLWAAAVRADESFIRTGELGIGLLCTPMVSPHETVAEQIGIYRKAFAAAQHGPDRRSQAVASLPVFVSADDAEAQRLGDEYLTHYWKVWEDSATCWDGVSSKDYPSYSGMVNTLRKFTPAEWRKRGSGFFGSPQRVAEQIAAFHATTGADGLIAQVDFGAVAGDVAERSLRLFIDEVAPLVREL